MTPVIVAAAVAFVLWWAGLYLLWRVPLCTGSRQGSVMHGCTVIVPARNEAHNLPRLLESLKPQLAADDEVLVVDDHSDDDTPGVAAAHGARLIESKERPDGWTGKTWACWQGAQSASNELLVFVDADTWLARDSLERMIGTLGQRRGLVSVQPYHCMEKPHERLSALFNLMVLIGVDAFALGRVNRAPSGSFGPCILCSKEDYFLAGGHERVRGMVLENLALGPLFQQAGLPVSCYGGARTVFFRMYPGGIGELVEGWTKGFASGAARTPPLTMALAVTWISGAFSAAIVAATAAVTPGLLPKAAAGAVYAVYAGQLYWMLRRVGNFGIAACILFPIHLLFFALIYSKSFVAIFVRKSVRWKGRTVSVGSR
jgi:4,4'-diaponeurosporenoate glycosyltransferase